MKNQNHCLFCPEIPRFGTKIQHFFFFQTSPNTIDEYAFYGCSDLISIIIPDSVTTIDDYAFFKCTGLTSIILPDNVNSMGNNTFENCINLTHITLSNNLTTIANLVFKLIEVMIPENVTAIGDYSFIGCVNLSHIILPDSLTSIGVGAFYECSNLTEICYNGSESEWNNITIGYNNEVIENINIYFNPAPTNAGDVNNDGEVSIIDVISVLKYIIGSIDLTDKQLANADLNKDSEVTVIDAILLQKMILEMV